MKRRFSAAVDHGQQPVSQEGVSGSSSTPTQKKSSIETYAEEVSQRVTQEQWDLMGLAKQLLNESGAKIL
ncbi:MAG TPA: hypothetical protein VMF10_12650 [Candidatus Aquilonibacter sp.]|nr:hypothetical protein [Candidatus Aquilonibacter sp.]